jgi:CSLREA domain-containing protein
MMRTRGGLVAFSCAVGLLITTSAPALADNTITVTTTSDEVANNGPCSLREALAEANAPGTIDDCPGAVAGQPTTIVLDAHVYEWTHGEVVISTQSGLTIRGASASDPSQTKIDAKHTSRIFTVDSAADLAITALTLTGGKAPDGARGNDGGTGVDGAAGNPGGAGGAILNYGHVTLTDAAVAGNRAGDGGDGGPGAHGGLNSLPTRGGEGGHGGDGGGIVNYGTLALTRTVVSDNASGAGGAGGAPGDYYFDSFQGSDGLAASDGGLGGFGGGISNLGTMTMTHSTVRANTTGAGGDGGPGGNGAPGVCGDAGSGQPQYDGGSGAVGGTGVTAGRGGGISNYGTLTVSDSTIATNQTGPGGSGGAGGGGGVGAYFSCEASNADTTSDGGPGGTGGLGGSGGSGGGLFNAGSLTLTGAIISGNIAGIGGAGGSGGGGGYGSDGCDFDSGSGGNGGKGGAAGPGGPGGGVGMIDGSLSVTNVTIYNNTAGDGGLGGFIGPGGGAGRVGGFLNCGSNGHVGSAGSDGTPAGDGGDGGSGGGLVVAGTVTGAQVAHATIDANSAGGPGGTFAGLGGSPGSPGVAGGVAGGAGASVTVLNSIMSVDAPAGGCAGTVVDGGHNVTSGGDTACPGVGGDVKLGLLQDNGERAGLRRHRPARRRAPAGLGLRRRRVRADGTDMQRRGDVDKSRSGACRAAGVR